MCFNAALGIKSIMNLNPRSVILTSGTLSPLDSFQAELGCEFKQKLESKHVIDPKQVLISVLKSGVRNQTFDFSYKNRSSNDAMYGDLGHSMLKIAENTPGGILMFFPSYYLMEYCHQKWLENGFLQRIENVKIIVKEPKDSSKFKSTME